MSDKTPYCCGKEAEWVVQSINLAYFYCRQCKNEVRALSGNESDREQLDWAGEFNKLVHVQNAILRTDPSGNQTWHISAPSQTPTNAPGTTNAPGSIPTPQPATASHSWGLSTNDCDYCGVTYLQFLAGVAPSCGGVVGNKTVTYWGTRVLKSVSPAVKTDPVTSLVRNSTLQVLSKVLKKEVRNEDLPYLDLKWVSKIIRGRTDISPSLLVQTANDLNKVIMELG